MESHLVEEVLPVKFDNANDVDEVGEEIRNHMTNNGKVKLEANDGTLVTVDWVTACKSQLIKAMLQDLGIKADDVRLEHPIPVHKADGKTLKKIMEHCELKKDVEYIPKGEHEDPRIALNDEDLEYLNVSPDELLQIMLGADYLEIPEIYDITTQQIANMGIGKSVEELRDTYGLENDLTPEEEEEVRRRYAWAEI